MQVAHLYLELKFAPSVAYLARNMLLAEPLAKSMPSFTTDTVSIRFQSEDAGTQLQIEPGRIWVALHGASASATKCASVMTDTLKEWRKIVGPLPEYSRVGFRSQVFFESSMSREELISIYAPVLFSDGYREKFSDADFAVTVEDFKGLEGRRIFAGAMHHDEIVAKWTPTFRIEREGLSYFTLDFDHGSGKVQELGVDAFVLESWADVIETATWFSAPIQ